MRIIEHGDTFELGTQICPKCNCVFAFTKKDITNYRYIDYSSYDHDEYDEYILYCPECDHKIDYYPPSDHKGGSK